MDFKREDFLKELIETNPSLILLVFTRNGIVVDFNKNMVDLYGWEREKTIQNSYLDVCKKNDHPIIAEDFLKLLRRQLPPSQKMITHTATNGKTVAIEWRVVYSEDNEYIILIGADISFLHYKSDIENYLRGIIDNIPHYIFWKDRNSVFLGCNQAFAQIAGLKNSEDIAGKRDYDLPWAAEESKRYISDDQEIIESRKPKLNYEEKQTRIDGTEEVGLVSKVPIEDANGNICGVLGIYTDITQLKADEARLQEAIKVSEAANRVKTEFILNIQHDIRTPIIGIVGMTSLLAQQQHDQTLKSNLVEVSNCAKELLDYCNEIIEFSNIEHSSPSVVTAPFELKKLLDDVMMIELPAARYKSLSLSLQYDPTIPYLVMGDSYRLKRILINLISNAIKFTVQGYIKVTVIADSIHLDKREIIIQFLIEDTGIGIPDDKKNTIFEKFSKVVPSNKGLYKGNGFGLRIVKQFIEEMEGDISVESELNHGSLFKVFLLFKLPLSQNILSSPEPRTFAVRHSKKKILLVEDSHLVQKVEQIILQQLNCEVDLAESGEDAINHCTQNQYDIVFMDIGLPGIDGFKAAEEIRRLTNEQALHPAIIALTAHDCEEFRIKAANLGINEYCVKPLTFQTAKQLISKLE